MVYDVNILIYDFGSEDSGSNWRFKIELYILKRLKNRCFVLKEN